MARSTTQPRCVATCATSDEPTAGSAARGCPGARSRRCWTGPSAEHPRRRHRRSRHPDRPSQRRSAARPGCPHRRRQPRRGHRRCVRRHPDLIPTRPRSGGRGRPSLPYADDAFDIGHVSLVLHHLDPFEAVAFLRELARVACRRRRQRSRPNETYPGRRLARPPSRETDTAATTRRCRPGGRTRAQSRASCSRPPSISGRGRSRGLAGHRRARRRAAPAVPAMPADPSEPSATD